MRNLRSVIESIKKTEASNVDYKANGQKILEMLQAKEEEKIVTFLKEMDGPGAALSTINMLHNVSNLGHNFQPYYEEILGRACNA